MWPRAVGREMPWPARAASRYRGLVRLFVSLRGLTSLATRYRGLARLAARYRGLVRHDATPRLTTATSTSLSRAIPFWPRLRPLNVVRAFCCHRSVICFRLDQNCFTFGSCHIKASTIPSQDCTALCEGNVTRFGTSRLHLFSLVSAASMASVGLPFDCCILSSFSFDSHGCWPAPGGVRPNTFVLIVLFYLFL